MPGESSAAIVLIMQDLLDALRDSRLVAPCEECGYPVPTPITYDGTWLCSQHAPELDIEPEDLITEMEEPEDG